MVEILWLVGKLLSLVDLNVHPKKKTFCFYCKLVEGQNMLLSNREKLPLLHQAIIIGRKLFKIITFMRIVTPIRKL